MNAMVRSSIDVRRHPSGSRHGAGRGPAGVLGVILAFVPIAAAGAETLRLTLAEAVERARAASPGLERLRALHEGAGAGLDGARAERAPVLDLTAGYTRYSDVPVLSITQPGPPVVTRTIFPNIPDQYTARLGVSVPLYTGGRLTRRIEAAEKDREAAGRDVDSGAQDLVLETTTAYWSLVTAVESEHVLAEAVKSFDAHAADAVNRERFGLAARNETLAVQVERDRAELVRLQAANDAEVAGSDLVRLLDLPGGSRVEATEPLTRPEIAAAGTETLVAEALEARPDRAALRARIEAAEARSGAARSERLPQAKFSAGYDYARPNRRILPLEDVFEDTWDASVTVSFNVFDGGRRAAAIAERTYEAEASRRLLEDLDRRIRLDVTRRRLEVDTALAALSVAERNLEAARENHRVASERHRAGVIPSSDRLDAEVALLRAGLDRTSALTGLRLALARLDRAVGR